MSRSSPAMSAAFNLRAFTSKQKPLQLEREEARASPQTVHLDTVKAQEYRKKMLERKELWRQREEDERGEEAAKRKAEEKMLRLEKERAEAQKQQRAEAHRRDVVRRHVAAEEARRQQEREETLRRRREQEEEIRQRREAAERERQRRMPKTCESCAGSGKCQDCSGEGFTLTTFIGSAVADSDLEFGRKPLGCHACGGYHHGVFGETKMGLGYCLACDGHGKIWPKIDEDEQSPFMRRGRRPPTAGSPPASPSAAKRGGEESPSGD